MAKYSIKHSCGHTVIHQLFGKYEERYRRIAYLEKCPCDECHRTKVNAEALATAKERGLTELIGSDKQVAWATTIRERAYKALECLEEFNVNTQTQDLLDGWKNKMDAISDAKWWIDNRHSMPEPFSSQSEASRRSAAHYTVASFRKLFE